MSNRRPYVRPMDNWWMRDPFFVRYMAREFTAVFVAAYAVVLLFGLVRLSQGEAAFNGWLQYLKTPWMLVFHVIVLATFVYHTWSWFSIMPKTMPIMFVGGKRVQPGTITGAGIAAATVACLAVLLIAGGMHS
jgi:succinate dehydrogenase subunit C